MPIDLHPQARVAAKASLAQGLGAVKIENGVFVNRLSAFIAAYKADEALPSNGSLHDQLVKFIDERPLIEFTTELLRIYLRDNHDYVSEPKESSLQDIEGFEDNDKIAEWILSEFTTLPWTYSVALELPQGSMPIEVLEDGERKIGEYCHLASADLFLSDRFPLSHPNERRSMALREGGLFALIGSGPMEK